VPAGEPWRKAEREVTPANVRLRMVEAAVAAALPWAEVSAIEVERAGPTYTVETLAQLAAAEPSVEWWFLLGRDALEDLPRWHEPRRLLERARLGVAQRPDADAEQPAAGLLEALPELAGRIDRVPMPRLEVSASELRRRVRLGLPTEALLPVAVRRVIDEFGLYRAREVET